MSRGPLVVLLLTALLPLGRGARAEAVDCRVYSNLYLCLSAGRLLNVAFEDATAVQTIDDIELHLEDLRLEDVSEVAFADVSNASALYLRGNGIARLARHYFRSLEQLTYLDLKDNRIEAIEEGAFARLPNLETLLLDGNRLATLQPGVWRGLGGLHELYATNNSLVPRRGMFRGLRQLETLALDANGIAEIPVGTFEGLRHLDLLYLSRNRITNVSSEVFQGLGELSELDLGGNRIASLHRETFKFLSDLEKLWLSGNNLTAVRNLDFKGLEGLERLYLNGNNLENVDVTAFNVFKNVTIEPGFKINGILVKSFKGANGKYHCTLAREFQDPYECRRIVDRRH